MGARAYFDRNDRRINNFTVGENGFFEQEFHAYEVGIAKRNATGGLVSLRSVTEYDHNNNPQRIFGAGWDTYIAAEARQPLLQGAGVMFNRIGGPDAEPGFANGVLIARTRTDISLADFEIAVRNLVSDVENAYWDLYFAYRDLDAKIEARNRVLEVWNNVQANVETGRVGSDAEAQAREQYFRFEAEVVNALHGRLVERTRTNNGTLGGTFNNPGGVRVAERRLRFMMNLPQTNGRLIRPATEAPVAKVRFDWPAIAAEALARRPELRRQKWVVKQRELELLSNRNFLKPNLDLVARYRQRGFGGQLDGGAGALNSLTDDGFGEYQLGVEFDMPIGFRRAHAAVRSSELSVARAKAVLEEQEQQVMFGLSNTYADIERSYEIMQLLFNRREAAHAQVASVHASYTAGRAPIDLLLEAQRRVIDSTILFNQARVDYALAIKNVHYEKGSLLEFYNVALAEGPWPQKAYDDALLRDLNKRRAHMDYVINDAVIGQPKATGRTLHPQGGEIVLPPGEGVPVEAVRPADVQPLGNNPLRRPAQGSREVRVASHAKPGLKVARPATPAPAETPTLQAPIIEAKEASPQENFSFGSDAGNEAVWLH